MIRRELQATDAETPGPEMGKVMKWWDGTH
jgi:hypothetical protein